ncbi:MAG: hypothetical protein K0U20_08250 [Proteobacteria bacterium]|nr:hypothetical protein [Pseudomonadota bacterium]
MLINTHEERMRNAYTLWYNGVDFKEYFKLRAEEGGSLVFEMSDYHAYCEQCRIAAEEHDDPMMSHWGENV